MNAGPLRSRVNTCACMPMSDEEQVRAMLEADPSKGSPADELHAGVPGPDERGAPVAAPKVAPAGASPADRRTATTGARDVPISTVVHLLGLSTASQIAVLEDKVDALSTRVNNIAQKLERMAHDLHHAAHSNTIERLDVQVNDLRALLKRLAPKFGAAIEGEPDAGTPQGGSGVRSRILASGPTPSPRSSPAVADSPAVSAPASQPEAAPAAASKPEPERDVLAEEEDKKDDASFQSGEARRIRIQSSQGK